MNSKKLGIVIIILIIILSISFGIFLIKAITEINSEIELNEEGICIHDEIETCPHQKVNNLMLPSFIIGSVLIVILIIGIYLAFFDKSHKQTIEAIKDIKDKESDEEKFNILLQGLDKAEQKVIIAVKEQDGISQSTLMLRTDLSKTKLSLVLKGLENKDLISKKIDGKINHIFLKKAI
tara:strand:+ start:1195 stop:1731 length:537 start_codon:yes stop_codon:yes gene_type:complete